METLFFFVQLYTLWLNWPENYGAQSFYFFLHNAERI